MASITLFISSGVIVPALRRIIFLSAVKIRVGRINDPLDNEPERKSSGLIDSANISSVGIDVIWQSIMSSPRRSDKTKAGRRLFLDKSVKGKGVITISPFTNLSMLHPLRELTNLSPIHFHLQNESKWGLHFCKDLFQPYRPICVPLQTTIGRCFLICFVSPMFPSNYNNFITKLHHFFTLSIKNQ